MLVSEKEKNVESKRFAGKCWSGLSMHLPQLLVLHRAERAILLERMGQSEQSVRCSVKCSAKRSAKCSAKWDGSQAGELVI